MNNLNRDNDKIDDYFFLIIKQALEKKYYLIFFIIITFAYAIYQYSNKTFTYKSDYIIKKNENIDISLNKIFSSLTDTNNRFEVLNKFVSTQKANEEKANEETEETTEETTDVKLAAEDDEADNDED